MIFSFIRISFQKLNLDDQSNFCFLLIWILFYICSFWKTKHKINKSEFCQSLMWWTVTGKLEIKLKINLNKKVQRNKNFPDMFLLLTHYCAFHIHANSEVKSRLLNRIFPAVNHNHINSLHVMFTFRCELIKAILLCVNAKSRNISLAICPNQKTTSLTDLLK